MERRPSDEVARREDGGRRGGGGEHEAEDPHVFARRRQVHRRVPLRVGGVEGAARVREEQRCHLQSAVRHRRVQRRRARPRARVELRCGEEARVLRVAAGRHLWVEERGRELEVTLARSDVERPLALGRLGGGGGAGLQQQRSRLRVRRRVALHREVECRLTLRVEQVDGDPLLFEEEPHELDVAAPRRRGAASPSSKTGGGRQPRPVPRPAPRPPPPPGRRRAS